LKAKNIIVQYSLVTWVFFLITFLFVSTSWATAPHWVDDNGTADWGSCQSASSLSGVSACSLTTANANASAGDTVYFRAGDYSTAISPKNSGTAGNVITWSAYNSEDVNLTNTKYAIYLDNDDYQKFVDFDADVGGWYIKAINGSDNIEVDSCTFSGSNKYAGLDISSCSDWNIHDTFFGPNGIGDAQDSNTAPLVASNSIRIYIHDNTFEDCGSHSCIGFGDGGAISYSVIKDNIFYNTGLNTTLLPGGPLYNWYDQNHTGATDVMVGVIKGSSYNLIEGNTFYESGDNIGDDHTAAFKTANATGNIFRKNIVYNMDQFAAEIYTDDRSGSAAQYNMFYNNTIYNSGSDDDNTPESGAFTYYSYVTKHIQYNQVVNNIISDHQRYAFGYGSSVGTAYVHDNVYHWNLLYQSDLSGNEVNRFNSGKTIEYAESNYPTEYLSNVFNVLDVNPSFTTPGSDFTLKAGSPCIDAGFWLAQIRSATGSGTSFVVDNPYFFTDGYGIPEFSGDLIQLEGDSSQVRVTNINYSTATITVNKPISWTKGQGVSLQYYGSRPDIGAHEYGFGNDELSAPSGLQIIVQ